MPSFDEFVLDFAEWCEEVAARQDAADTPAFLTCLEYLEGDAAQATASQPPPLGPGWDADVVAQVTRLEVWGTTFAAPEDFCEFRGFAGEKLVATTRLPGY